MSSLLDTSRMSAVGRQLVSRVRLPVTPMGYREILLYSGGLTLLAAGLASRWPWAAMPPVLLAGFVVWFFRDPHRTIPACPGLFVSPADGVVTHVEELP